MFGPALISTLQKKVQIYVQFMSENIQKNSSIVCGFLRNFCGNICEKFQKKDIQTYNFRFIKLSNNLISIQVNDNLNVVKIQFNFEFLFKSYVKPAKRGETQYSKIGVIFHGILKEIQNYNWILMIFKFLLFWKLNCY